VVSGGGGWFYEEQLKNTRLEFLERELENLQAFGVKNCLGYGLLFIGE
jgi:hypothetical protein